MTLVSPHISHSYSRRIAEKSGFALRAATALLMTAAAALILIHANAWGGVPPDELDLVAMFY